MLAATEEEVVLNIEQSVGFGLDTIDYDPFWFIIYISKYFCTVKKSFCAVIVWSQGRMMWASLDMLVLTFWGILILVSWCMHIHALCWWKLLPYFDYGMNWCFGIELTIVCCSHMIYPCSLECCYMLLHIACQTSTRDEVFQVKLDVKYTN